MQRGGGEKKNKKKKGEKKRAAPWAPVLTLSPGIAAFLPAPLPACPLSPPAPERGGGGSGGGGIAARTGGPLLPPAQRWGAAGSSARRLRLCGKRGGDGGSEPRCGEPPGGEGRWGAQHPPRHPSRCGHPGAVCRRRGKGCWGKMAAPQRAGSGAARARAQQGRERGQAPARRGFGVGGDVLGGFILPPSLPPPLSRCWGSPG